MYCILGAQAKTRSPIVGASGSAFETQQYFGDLIEKTVKEDLAESVSNFQTAVLDANCRLDLAMFPGLWLMPSNLLINTESVYGYPTDDIWSEPGSEHQEVQAPPQKHATNGGGEEMPTRGKPSRTTEPTYGKLTRYKHSSSPTRGKLQSPRPKPAREKSSRGGRCGRGRGLVDVQVFIRHSSSFSPALGGGSRPLG